MNINLQDILLLATMRSSLRIIIQKQRHQNKSCEWTEGVETDDEPLKFRILLISKLSPLK